MRHGKTHRKLGRTASHRRALLRHLVTALFSSKDGRIKTTLPKAKEARPVAEKMITFGKRDDLHARRLVLRYVTDTLVVRKLFSDISPRYATRPGGYTRIVKLGFRKGDGAEVAYLELVGGGAEAPASTDEAKSKAVKELKPAKEAKAREPKKAKEAKAKAGESKKKAPAKATAKA